MNSRSGRFCRRNPALLLAALVLSYGVFPPTVAAQPGVQPMPAGIVEAMLASPERDIFALRAALPRIDDPSLALLARARIAAAQAEGVKALQWSDRFLAGNSVTPRQRALAWEIATDAAFANGDYAEAVQAAQHLQTAFVASDGNVAKRASAAQTEAMAARLAKLPAQRVVAYRPHREPVHRDKEGLPRAEAIINGHAQDVVLDTGANLSVLSLSTARRLGLHLQQDDTSVASPTRAAVTVRLGVAETLRFAGLTLRNVAFLVVDDKQLTMSVPGGYRIDAIVGFPVLRALQRFRITAAGQFVPSLSPDTVLANSGNLMLVGNDIYVQAAVDSIPVAMRLDSGAASSSLSATFARQHANLVKGLRSRHAHVAAAGGAMEIRNAMWPGVHLRVDDHETVLARLGVELGGSTNSAPNVLGDDVLGAFDWWSIDFARMQLEVGPPKPKVLDTKAPSGRAP